LVSVAWVLWGFRSILGRVAAIEEVVLSKTCEITRPGCVVIISARRAFLQFLHHDHTQPPLAGFCGALDVTI
jgi:hypothetical protein